MLTVGNVVISSIKRMSLEGSLHLSRGLLAALGTRLFIYHENRIPSEGSVLLVSNHRSFMDAPLLITALRRPVRFACHHYMGQVPGLREVVQQLGCFPLEADEQRQHSFFRKATELLQAQQVVGVFPEGAQSMVRLNQLNQLQEFHRGFAHLALRAPVDDLQVLPVAIVPFAEQTDFGFPVRLLSLFDPSEPLFNQEGWHPMVVYQRVNILIGRPYWVKPALRAQYQGKSAKQAVKELIHYCRHEIECLIQEGWN